MMAARIQRKRTKGWRMPDGAIYVGRPTIWGNPFNWQDWVENWPFKSPRPNPWSDTTDRDRWCREQAVQEFANAIASGELTIQVAALRGKTLACWCPTGQWCHADVLLEPANG